MAKDVYIQLARFLDHLPGGYPATDTGVELRILQRMFTEEEAALAQCLSLRPEPVETIAERAGRRPGDIAANLEAMSKSGSIYRVRRDGAPRYAAAQFVIGIWEYHVNDLTPELIRDFNEYIPHLFQHEIWHQAPQLRTIPIGESISVGRDILPHEEAELLVREQEVIAVAPCICRREHALVGEGCGASEETCLIFGHPAEYYIENGFGRAIDVAEALAILQLAEEEGLVLQPSNAKNIANICCCCGCCCQVLRSFKRHPQPASIVSTPFQVQTEPELCIGCEECIDRCQMEALSMVDAVAVVDLDRCIGCGLCVTACSSESLYLVRKPVERQTEVPQSLARTYMNLAKVRGVK